jgi:CheR methyltransferase-like protein
MQSLEQNPFRHMSLVPRTVLAFAALSCLGAGLPAKRTIAPADLGAELRERLPRASASEEAFREYVASLRRETARRERDGEYEHLVYYLLQSRHFTDLPPIEPALSAYELLHAGPAPSPRAPDAVRRRVADFVKAVAGSPSEPRLAWFKHLLQQERPAGTKLEDRLLCEYARVMDFLYAKEFLAQARKDPQEREAYLASLYQTRGHSTDTQVEAGFAVYQALAVLKARGAAQLERVLIVGPGLDFAPRTDLLDAFPPQSYQPFAVADALIGLGLADAQRLRVDCVDVNQRVLDHFRGQRGAAPRLRLVSGIPLRGDASLDAEFRDYFERLGRSIGEDEPLAQPLPGRLGKSLSVRKQIASRIDADRLDIVTERYAPSPGYDLVVVTNVLGYFDPAQQALALANIESMLKQGGRLIHNEPQTSLVHAAQALGLALVDARSVRLGSALFDRVLIHEKSPRKAVPKEGP